MNQLPGLPTVEEWIADMKAISARTDMTYEEKVALVEEKIKDYKEKQRVLLDAEEQRRAELRKSMMPHEQDLDKSRWSFERKLREGKAFVRYVPDYPSEESDEGNKESK